MKFINQFFYYKINIIQHFIQKNKIQQKIISQILDQRSMKNINDMYYFKLIPLTLTIQNSSSNYFQEQNTKIRLKINNRSKICDQIKKAAALQVNNGKVLFNNVNLDFTILSFNPNRSMQFTLILLKTSEDIQEIQLGKYTIVSKTYVQEFYDNKKNYFKENIKIGQDFQLQFLIFIDNSRFSLEKAVKQINQQNIRNSQSSRLKKQSQGIKKQELNENISEVLSENERREVFTRQKDGFMSVSRKIVRKPVQTRKFLRKQYSPAKSQQKQFQNRTKKIIGLNLLAQTNSNTKIQSLAQQQARKLSQKIIQQQQKIKKAQQEKVVADLKRKQLEQKRRNQQVQKTKKVEQQKAAALQRKNAQQKKQKQQQIRKKNEQSRRLAQQKRAQEKRKKQLLQMKRIQQARKLESLRLEQQRQLQEKRRKDEQKAKKFQQERRILQLKKLEALKKRQQEQAVLKVAEQKKLQIKKKREEERAKKLQQQRKETAKRLQQKKRQEQLEKQQQENRKIFQQQLIEVQRKQKEQKQKITSFKQKLRKDKNKINLNVVTQKKQQQLPVQKDLLQKNLDISINKKRRQSFTVKVTSEESRQIRKQVFNADLLLQSIKSKKSIIIKKTQSAIYQQDGDVLKSKPKANLLDMKVKIIIGILIVLAILFTVNMMMPSTQNISKKKRKTKH